MLNNIITGYKNKIKYSNHSRNRNVWVFGEWFGERCNDNCLYLANYIVRSHPEIEVKWIAKPEADLSLLDSKIQILQKNSAESIGILKKCGVVIMNQGLSDLTDDKVFYYGGAISLNLWHGLMWKKINYDAAGHHGILANVYHKIMSGFENAEFFLSSSTEMQKHVISAFKINENRLIRGGYPRNSIFYKEEEIEKAKEKVLQIIRNKSSAYSEGVRVLTYMPTFRDNTDDVFSFFSLAENDAFIRLLEKYNVIIVEKSHFISSRRGSNTSITHPRIISINEIGASELLAGSDILITDYSSCFFDFLILDRPIVHFVYDYDYYVNNDRGVYYTKDEIACGKVISNVDELMEAIESYLLNPNEDRELRAKQRYLCWEFDSADTCENIYQAIRRLQKV